MKTLIISILIILTGDVTIPFLTSVSQIEKCRIPSFVSNPKVQFNLLNSNVSTSILIRQGPDFKIRQTNNGSDQNELVIGEDVNGFIKSGINLVSEKNDQPLSLKRLIINAEVKSERSRSLKMQVADISQRGIAEW